MHGRTVLTFVVAASLMIVGATGTVVADPGAGMSGSCDDGETNGGGEMHVGQDEVSLTDPDEAVSTVTGFALVVQRTADEGEPACDGDGTTEPDGDKDADYLEAHADAGPAAAQVCVDQTFTSGNGSPVLVTGSPEGEPDHDGSNDNRDCEYNQDGEEEGMTVVP